MASALKIKCPTLLLNFRIRLFLESTVSVKCQDIVTQYPFKFNHYTVLSLSAGSRLKNQLLGGLSCLLFGEIG